MFESKSGVYIIKCIPTNKYLIGETGNVRKRINYHIQNLKGNRHENPYLQKAWNKYGYDNFSFEVLEYCNFSDCKIREDYYCKLYDTHNSKKGFNLRPTGKELKNKFSDEHKEKIKQCLKSSERFKNRDCGKGMRGKTHSLETKIKISESSKGKKHSEETKQLLSSINRGRKKSTLEINKIISSRKNNGKPWHSFETINKIRNANLGRKMSTEHLKNNTLSKYKPILQYDLEGNFIKEWLGASQVRDVLGYNQANITGVCNGLRKTHKGYIWKYK